MIYIYLYTYTFICIDQYIHLNIYVCECIHVYNYMPYLQKEPYFSRALLRMRDIDIQEEGIDTELYSYLREIGTEL